MSEQTTPRKVKLLLAVLLVIWAGVSVNAVLDLEQEGAVVCERLAYSVEKYPGEQRPCLVSTFRSDGEHIRTMRTRFEDGGLVRAEFDGDGDGVYDREIDCSLWGRVTMPLFHTRRWLGVAVSNEMNRDAPSLEFVEQRTESDGEDTVVFFETSKKDDPLSHRRRDRRDADDQLIERRLYQGSFEPPLRTLVLTYDDMGRVETVSRRTEMPPSETLIRLEYECGDRQR
ncbi:MAG: hypothetical protein ACQEVA_09185 [Myxococcota bacterium]